MEMAWADFFLGPDRPKSGTSSPVTVTNPATHAKNKAQPAQSPFFYEPLITLIKLKGFQKLLKAR